MSVNFADFDQHILLTSLFKSTSTPPSTIQTLHPHLLDKLLDEFTMSTQRFPTRVPCTYKECSGVFTSAGEMKRHKANEHDYCSRCDEDFQDDEYLLLHKIKSDKHIVCVVCGIDFRSEGGRDLHTRQVGIVHIGIC